MRLINSVPINKLCHLGLPRPIFEQAKSLIAYGEHLKVTEQKLNFLIRCKKNRVVPVFIYNSVFVNYGTLYSGSSPQYVSQLTQDIRRHALNSNITQQYDYISHLKQQIGVFKNWVYNQCDYGLFLSIMCIFEAHVLYIKDFYKEHLKRRYDWLVFKYYPTPPINVQHIPGLDDDRVTLINCDNLSPEELSLLALGPNFCITPKIDEKFMDTLKVDIAHTIFKTRHQEAYAATRSTVVTHILPDTASNVEQEVTPPLRNMFSDVKRKCPFQYSFTKTPDACSPETEDKLSQLNRFIINLTSKQKITSNLNRKQQDGMKSLCRRKDELHYSVSDKCGEFVVTKVEDHKQLTLNHLSETPVYKHIPPTKKVKGLHVRISNPTTEQLSQLIKKKNRDLIQSTNELWKEICKNRDLPDKLKHLLRVSNTALPCMYVQVKTHKNPPETFKQHVTISSLKVRPIISCVDCPTEKLAWLVTDILSPLLNFIPSHLTGLYKHLDDLKAIQPQQLVGQKFFSADVSALYTNISSTRCIENVIDLAEEHLDQLDLLGLNLTDIHKILEHILANSFFTFDSRLYQQLDGLFMGLRPSPVLAVVRMYYLERNSIYLELIIAPAVPVDFYKRYIDDAASTARDKNTALAIMNSIAEQDEDGKVKWELEYPENDTDYIPFLNSEINIRPDGTISSRLYRKPTKKWITLHSKSHHPDTVKINTIRNSYKEARLLSSGPEELEYSLKIVDTLYKKNGFQNPRQHDTPPISPTSTALPARAVQEHLVTLTLDFISEHVANKIRNEVKRLGLPIRLNFVSKNKLKTKLCSSRPYDKRVCRLTGDCKICPLIITINKDCSVKNIVYKIDCLICIQFYLGETERTAHDRLGEHLRYAKYPNTPSNKKEALAIHYATEHPGCEPNLKFSVLTIEPNTVRRKIFEALVISSMKPSLNLKEELKTVQRFLTHRARV
jgi:hypothetical protein